MHIFTVLFAFNNEFLWHCWAIGSYCNPVETKDESRPLGE